MAPSRLLFVLGIGIAGCARQVSPPPADVTLPAPTATVATVPSATTPPPVAKSEPEPVEPEPIEEDDAPPPTPTATTPSVAVASTSAATQPHLSAALDPRKGARAQALLTTEIQGLRRLAATTPQSAPDRPALLRRLAADYAELRKAGVASASANAISTYEEILRTYPSTPQADEDRYYLALEYMVSGDLPKARRAFYELIRNSPSSKYVPYAYFAFGEAFFAEAKRDPSKWDLAKQAYVEVLKFAQSPIAPEAALQLYYVAKAKGDTAFATKMRALLASQYPTSPAAARARQLP